MDLRDFVAETLSQIVEGVALSAERISNLGGAVSPAFIPRSEDRLGTTKDGRGAVVYGVSFDVAVVASASGGQEGGARLEVAGLGGFGGKKTTGSKEETTSRVQFVVPLALPTDPKSRDAADQIQKEKEADRRRQDALVRAHNTGGSWAA